MLDDSPLAPTSAAERAQLREALVKAAGQELDRIRILRQQDAAVALSTTTDDASTGMPSAMALKLQQVAGAEQAKKTGALAKTVSPSEAKALFDSYANNPRIPHDFIDEGCHFRAHVGAKLLEDAGVYSEKAFCVPDGGDLKIDSDLSPIGFTIGMFHTAPVIWVDAKDGPERRVLDPSMFDGPVPVEVWQAEMSGLNGKDTDVLYLPRFAQHLMDRDEPPTTWNQKDLDDARAWNTEYKAVEKAMGEMNFHAHLQELVADAKVTASGQAEDRAQEASDDAEIVIEEED